jgi:Domain of unknown function (DUF4037)
LRGLELSRRFYEEAVRPVLERRFPRLEHAAALIGEGSEVLGLDDEVSQDHHWGPRVQLFVRDGGIAGAVVTALAHELPARFEGFSTNFGPELEPGGARLLVPVERGPVDHRVEVSTIGDFCRQRIGVDPLEGFGVADWLVTPAQRLLELTAGEVFRDPLGDVTAVRRMLAWYPHDVWLLVMAGHWRRVAQLEHLHGRAGSRGDELGSRLIGASLVADVMGLAFAQERRYAPYPKWRGTVYARLARPEQQTLEAALEASDWRSREDALVEAYGHVAVAHNTLGVTEPLDPEPRQFRARGFRVLFADRFVDALRGAVTDPEARAVEHLAGAVDAVTDNTDVVTRPHLWRELCGLYDRPKPEDWRSDGV